ncbi:MAG TPA: FecR domain-containing protein, partial [Fontimonas sp.]
AYADLEELWDLSAELAREDPAIIAAAREARHGAGLAGFAYRRWPLLAAAASLMVVCMFFASMWMKPASVQAYATAVGEQRTLTLEDGSRVVLDTATQLDVRYDRNSRSVQLRQGRADFQVSKDPDRPFTVRAGGAAVTATGTQFQVRLDGDAGEVTLLEGRVVVEGRQSTGRTALSPGERMALLAGGTLGAIQRLSEADLANAGGWTGGQLVVQAWPVSALVAEVNRYGGTPLRLGDAMVGRLPVSGTFDPRAPEALALALENVWPVRVEHGASEIVLYAKK